jgi:hypothetical protein
MNGEWSHEDSLMEWNIYKRIPPQENVKMPEYKTTSAIFGMLFCCSLLLYGCFLISYYTKP